ncbi:MAG: VOC family protein [Oscillospiraceae bacterium]|nr:VOC family protein [Oscillospiraceae bacterium]
MEPVKTIGIAIDCEDENALVDFYVRMLNWTKTYSGNGYAVVSSPNESFMLVFQAVEHYQPPVWPWEKDKQAQMMHFDFFVENLNESVERAKAYGATVCKTQFFETSITMIDPAGHPFCLSTVWEEQLFV